jgi:hypothetical protein
MNRRTVDWFTRDIWRRFRRPIVSEEEYRLTLAKADEPDPTGRLARLLALARCTGRRITAIGELRASDVLLSADTLARVLPRPGRIRRSRATCPTVPFAGARRPTSRGTKTSRRSRRRPARRSSATYGRIRESATCGCSRSRSSRAGPINESLARILRIRAEVLAELPRIDRGGFHSYRRACASDRKHLPDVDVTRSAGWRDLATMKRSYQQPDPVTTLRVIENEPEQASSGHTLHTPQKASGGGSTA